MKRSKAAEIVRFRWFPLNSDHKNGFDPLLDLSEIAKMRLDAVSATEARKRSAPGGEHCDFASPKKF